MYKSCKLGMMPQKATKPKNCKKNMFKKKVLDLQGPPKKRSVFQKMFDRTCVHFILHERWFRYKELVGVTSVQPHAALEALYFYLLGATTNREMLSFV